MLSQFVTIFFLANRIFLRFCPQNFFWQKKNNLKNNRKSRPTYSNLFGHITGNKGLFVLGLTHITQGNPLMPNMVNITEYVITTITKDNPLMSNMV